MATFCKDKEAALRFIRRMSEEEFPVIVDTWTTDDVQEMMLVNGDDDDEAEEPALTREEAEVVLDSVACNYDSERGITNDILWNTASNLLDRKTERSF